jgi:hypothetical protein
MMSVLSPLPVVTLRLATPVAALLLATACGGQSGLSGNFEPEEGEVVEEGDTLAPTDGEEAPFANVECTHDYFGVTMDQAVQDNRDPNHPLFVYQARNSASSTFDEIQLFSFQAEPYYGPSGPGTYSLDGNNYEDCALCILLVMECDGDYACEKVFFADEGSLDIEAMGGGNNPFRATLNGAVFREVSIDPNTYRSTPVSGGDSWCLDNFDIDLTINLVN